MSLLTHDELIVNENCDPGQVNAASIEVMAEKPIPDPLYPCVNCSCDYSWPAADLYWSEHLRGWYCHMCWSEAHADLPGKCDPDYGICLADEIEARK